MSFRYSNNLRKGCFENCMQDKQDKQKLDSRMSTAHNLQQAAAACRNSKCMQQEWQDVVMASPTLDGMQQVPKLVNKVHWC